MLRMSVFWFTKIFTNAWYKCASQITAFIAEACLFYKLLLVSFQGHPEGLHKFGVSPSKHISITSKTLHWLLLTETTVSYNLSATHYPIPIIQLLMAASLIFSFILRVEALCELNFYTIVACKCWDRIKQSRCFIPFLKIKYWDWGLLVIFYLEQMDSSCHSW